VSETSTLDDKTQAAITPNKPKDTSLVKSPSKMTALAAVAWPVTLRLTDDACTAKDTSCKKDVRAKILNAMKR
jgi:hypothetical protein